MQSHYELANHSELFVCLKIESKEKWVEGYQIDRELEARVDSSVKLSRQRIFSVNKIIIRIAKVVGKMARIQVNHDLFIVIYKSLVRNPRRSGCKVR